MTVQLAAYDTESDACLAALPRIVEVHEQHEMPATFFIVARLLKAPDADGLRALKDHPLFEIACHTYTHMLLRDHPLCGEAGPAAEHRREVVDSKKRLEDAFGVEVHGFRTPVGFDDGLCGAPRLLELVTEAGYSYSSSLAWGPDYSLPAPILPAFSYAEQGHPGLWEIPPCGWHENLLKDHNRWGPRRLTLFPPAVPGPVLTDFVQSPAEEFAVHRFFLEAAVTSGAEHVSLIWHPWSLHRLDPGMSMLNMVFNHVCELGLASRTFAAHRKAPVEVAS
jgi:Polysaccharide deacetylase